MRPLFRPTLAACALAAAGLALAHAPARAADAAAAGKAAAQTSERQLVLPAQGPYSVALENLAGRVTVRGWNRNALVIQSRVRPTMALSGPEAEAFKQLQVAVSQPAPAEVAIKTTLAHQTSSFPAVLRNKLPHVEVDYALTVPPGVAVTIRQESGPITAYGVAGRVEAFSRDGAIALGGVTGRAEAANERGAITLADIAGDAAGTSWSGDVSARNVSGDLQAKTESGDVRVDVGPRWTGEIAYHTIRGAFRSDLATFDSEMGPGDTGWVGVLRGPLAGKQAPASRLVIDTISGSATVAVDRDARP
jgi:hypothetical protein